MFYCYGRLQWVFYDVYGRDGLWGSHLLCCNVELWGWWGKSKKGMNALISRDKSINFPPLSTHEGVFTIRRYELTICVAAYGAHFGKLSLWRSDGSYSLLGFISSLNMFIELALNKKLDVISLRWWTVSSRYSDFHAQK